MFNDENESITTFSNITTNTTGSVANNFHNIQEVSS
jgi:hypothetical protein